MEYTFLINQWESKGVPFKSHLHVPEVHPVTGYVFCEREDEGHVFKVTGKEHAPFNNCYRDIRD